MFFSSDEEMFLHGFIFFKKNCIHSQSYVCVWVHKRFFFFLMSIRFLWKDSRPTTRLIENLRKWRWILTVVTSEKFVISIYSVYQYARKNWINQVNELIPLKCYRWIQSDRSKINSQKIHKVFVINVIVNWVNYLSLDQRQLAATVICHVAISRILNNF